jgi:hypothetical protein
LESGGRGCSPGECGTMPEMRIPPPAPAEERPRGKS